MPLYLNLTLSIPLTAGLVTDPLFRDKLSFFPTPSKTPMQVKGSAYDVACDSCPVEGNNCTLPYYDNVQLCEPVLENTGSISPHGTLETLDLKPGYWRSSNTSRDIRECYEAAACVGGQQGLCASGYEGPCECTKLPVADFKPTLFIFLARYSPRTTRHTKLMRPMVYARVSQWVARVVFTAVSYPLSFLQPRREQVVCAIKAAVVLSSCCSTATYHIAQFYSRCLLATLLTAFGLHENSSYCRTNRLKRFARALLT